MHPPLTGALSILLVFMKRALAMVVYLLLCAFTVAPFCVLFLIYGFPPNVQSPRSLANFLLCVWSYEDPTLRFVDRVQVTLLTISTFLLLPTLGFFWQLDELLYGAKLDKVEITAPLFLMSAPRSGSTQFSRYLDEDDQLTGPCGLQELFPYLWMWHVVQRTLGRVLTKEWVSTKLEKGIPPELAERHGRCAVCSDLRQ